MSGKLHELLQVAATIHPSLLAKSITLATAESCTGGLLAFVLTELPGSSTYYLGGVSSYSNDAKSNILNVEKELIAEQGAVSRDVAVAMASGAKKLFSSQFAISITGIAGPGGGSELKPIGTVWCSIASESRKYSWLFSLEGTRADIRYQAAIASLSKLEELLRNDR